MPCKGICIHHKALGHYTAAHKRCKNCDLFIKWKGLRCPCCGCKLRTKPRNVKFKGRLTETKTIAVLTPRVGKYP